MATSSTIVGTITSLFRYPVKSMRGEAVQASKIGWHGLADDRRYAFLQETSRSGFPWLTARELPDLVRFEARIIEADGHSNVIVTTPGGNKYPVESDELCHHLANLAQRPLRLIQLWSGIFDSMDISIITQATMQSLSGLIGTDLDVRRFRPNIIVEATETRAFPEDKWVGGLLVFGDRPDSARVRANRKDQRCMVINLDPEQATQNPAILREVVQQRKNLAGVYGTAERPGTIQVGDSVYLVR
jgi:uncharacterized protein